MWTEVLTFNCTMAFELSNYDTMAFELAITDRQCLLYGKYNMVFWTLKLKPRPLLLACLESILGLFGSVLGPGWSIMSKSTGNWFNASTHAICKCNKQGTAGDIFKFRVVSSTSSYIRYKDFFYTVWWCPQACTIRFAEFLPPHPWISWVLLYLIHCPPR